MKTYRRPSEFLEAALSSLLAGFVTAADLVGLDGGGGGDETSSSESSNAAKEFYWNERVYLR